MRKTSSFLSWNLTATRRSRRCAQASSCCWAGATARFKANAEQKCAVLLLDYSKALNTIKVLIDIVQRNRVLVKQKTNLSAELQYATSVEEAVMMIVQKCRAPSVLAGVSLENVKRFPSLIVHTYARIQKAKRAIGDFERQVAKHVAEQAASGYSWLQNFDSDLLLLIARTCTFRTVAAARRTCTAIARLEGLGDLLPHLSSALG